MSWPVRARSTARIAAASFGPTRGTACRSSVFAAKNGVKRPKMIEQMGDRAAAQGGNQAQGKPLNQMKLELIGFSDICANFFLMVSQFTGTATALYFR